jgi:hypothetical protein
MGLDSPSNFRDVDTTVNSVSYSSTRDKGKLIVRSGRKAMGPSSTKSFGQPGYRTGMSDSTFTCPSKHSAIGPSDCVREVMA